MLSHAPKVVRLMVNPPAFFTLMEEQVYFDWLKRVHGVFAFEGYDALVYCPAVDNDALQTLLGIARRWCLPFPQFEIFNDDSYNGAYLRDPEKGWSKLIFPKGIPESSSRTVEPKLDNPPEWLGNDNLEHDEPSSYEGFTAEIGGLIDDPRGQGRFNSNGDFWAFANNFAEQGGCHWHVWKPQSKWFYAHYREIFPLPWMTVDPALLDLRFERLMFRSWLEERAFFMSLHRIDGIIGVYGDGEVVHALAHSQYFTTTARTWLDELLETIRVGNFQIEELRAQSK